MAEQRKRSTASKGRLRVKSQSSPYRSKDNAQMEQLRRQIDTAVERGKHLREAIEGKIQRPARKRAKR